jgi:pyruvate formate lyase activating enzyme
MWEHLSDDKTRLICDLCPRHCALRPGERGFCFVRENRDGQVASTTYGRSTGFCVDPIEKKPLYHFYPGTPVLSFGTPGCNLGCKFCQNWTMSRSRDVEAACEMALPKTIAATAQRLSCQSVAFTYNDPIIWAEYAIDTAKACRVLGVKTVAVTSGYISDTTRAAFYEPMDAANVDLKGFTDEFYRNYCGGRLQPVLDTLLWLVHESQTWVEITNLIIPGANDSPDDIARMCDWIVTKLGPDVPLHFSAFHPDFEMTDRGSTSVATLQAAYDVARGAGVRYVYTGNVYDPEHQHTYCPGCGRAVIRRDGYLVTAFDLKGGCCNHCQASIAGRFDDDAGVWGGRRMPVRIEN